MPPPPSALTIHEALTIADAQLVTFWTSLHKGVSGSQQKAVLLVLWAHQGQPISLRAIAERAGSSEITCWRAVKGLMRDRVVHRITGASANRPAAYTVDMLRLAELRVRGRLVLDAGEGRRAQAARARKAAS